MSPFPDHFEVVDDTAIGPQPWMNLRVVATAPAPPSVARTYDVSGGGNKDELVQSVQTHWTNNTPVLQWVYEMVTQGGCQMTLQCRSRGYLIQRHGREISEDGAGIVMNEASRFGVGADVGKGGILALGSAFAMAEVRENSATIPLIPQATGWFPVEPGEKFNARVEVQFKSEFWEDTAIDGGDSGTESRFISGELRLDLMALPAVARPPGRMTPTLVGGPGNISWDIEVDLGLADTLVSLDTPTGLAADDMLVAVLANQLGFDTDIQPVQEGWTLAHNRNEGLGGWEDVHMKIFVRPVGDPLAEPGWYEFTNGILAEEIGFLFALRGTASYDTSMTADGGGWAVASNLSRWRIVEEHISPSIERNGQLLICVSHFAHALWQAPITQLPPDGMTEVLDVPAGASTMSMAMLVDPPNPTIARQFTPSEWPYFSGHAIAATIVVPGAQLPVTRSNV